MKAQAARGCRDIVGIFDRNERFQPTQAQGFDSQGGQNVFLRFHRPERAISLATSLEPAVMQKLHSVSKVNTRF
jgi:hypothetical protein